MGQVTIIVLIGIAIGIGPGFVLTRKGRTLPWILSMVMLALVAAWFVFEGRAQDSGWDAIGYGIIAFVMIAPVAVGILVGGLAGLYRRRKAGQTTPHDTAS
ncbi:hypothetical protein [Pelagovum pacificum]|uniref:Uncharacterized protein n=1 Tax=Pelagovum pacificum TaxID=2588711 RepID=A0A5C5G7R7_9RHOB|nr:hypothetical protein [Pelagovum pacificum]QQA41841.1 hypothetical protein I8N54_13685 [Pelagovum pacificum]TNY30716.1 hypothetical protein FHY64_19245 [Pelagovum pacificum]